MSDNNVHLDVLLYEHGEDDTADTALTAEKNNEIEERTNKMSRLQSQLTNKEEEMKSQLVETNN